MADYYVENSAIKIGVNAHGAELVSLVDKKTGREYMWSGDSAYWGRVSPVLFPFVGKLNQSSYRVDGQEYTGIPQHGYARDCDFTMVSCEAETIWFELTDDATFYSNYPYHFLLRIGYRLEGKSVHVMWTVRNDDEKQMHFSIGAHPAFICEGMDTGKPYTMNFYTDKPSLTSGLIGEGGLLSSDTWEIELNEGKLVLADEMFDRDAFILDGSDIHTVSLEDEEGNEFLKVRFDTPQLGIWKPAGKNAPFVCIEPWYGRCDRIGFDKSLEAREYSNSLEPGHSFNKEYVIDIC